MALKVQHRWLLCGFLLLPCISGHTHHALAPRTAHHVRVVRLQGCHADLTTSKAYYRRFRICEAHMKSMSLSIEGRSCRFCQQWCVLCVLIVRAVRVVRGGMCWVPSGFC